MRDKSIVGEVFFVKRNERTTFELIRKGATGERKSYDV